MGGTSLWAFSIKKGLKKITRRRRRDERLSAATGQRWPLARCEGGSGQVRAAPGMRGSTLLPGLSVKPQREQRGNRAGQALDRGNGAFNVCRLVGRKGDGSPLLPLGFAPSFSGIHSADRPVEARRLVPLISRQCRALKEGCSCRAVAASSCQGCVHPLKGLVLVVAGAQ